jgi:hypothetical protein
MDGKFATGATTGATGGGSVTLTSANMPEHTHTGALHASVDAADSTGATPADGKHLAKSILTGPGSGPAIYRVGAGSDTAALAGLAIDNAGNETPEPVTVTPAYVGFHYCIAATASSVGTGTEGILAGISGLQDQVQDVKDSLDSKAPLASPTFTGTVSGVSKSMVGLGDVDNTSDADKPVSTATQTALDLKAPLASPTFTGTVGGVTKAMVGLGNVDNTSDADKPVSTAAQAALDLKAPLASPAFTGTPTVPTATASTDTTQAASMAAVHDVVQSIGLDGGTTSQGVYDLDNAGPGTFISVNGLESDAAANHWPSVGSASGTAQWWNVLTTGSSTRRTQVAWHGFNFGVSRTFVRTKHDSTWTSWVELATKASVDLKAPIASPTFTGTVSGVTKSMVGLGNVDNTSDADKPVSTATTAAISTSKTQLELNSQTGTTYTLVLADAGKRVDMSNASANTLTVPPNSSVAFPTNTLIFVSQGGAGQTSIAAGSGVTLNTAEGLKVEAQYKMVSLIKTATDTWLVIGTVA